MKHLVIALIAFAIGLYSTVALIGAVLATLEPNAHPSLIMLVFALVGSSGLAYIMCGAFFHKWRESRKTPRLNTETLIEGARNGWTDPERVRGIATHPRSVDIKHDDSGRVQITSMGE